VSRPRRSIHALSEREEERERERDRERDSRRERTRERELSEREKEIEREHTVEQDHKAGNTGGQVGVPTRESLPRRATQNTGLPRLLE